MKPLRNYKAAEEPIFMTALLNASQGADLARGLSQSCELLKFITNFIVVMALFIFFLKNIEVYTVGRLFSV